ncbi:conserved hypothetical protein [Paraburkholderia piptadeniae]|uniref:MAE-28990/MAE-18760-like HEPN domain-containing protein n=1 Tax=Paraburkholderia piptadeniae TaxID=1701573 RepID=A0A1N7S2Y4_9BURK|nr:MAE_28990/MAE_18760 family HEPN-like nuclease [Paraburkholderia piptadeniae]SIT41699.1 conserved hypothetical protein [Paraburkholderia piptadeniae]
MRQLRTVDLLLEHLDEDMAWRIKEVHQFKTAVEKASGKNVDAHIRAGIAMLYAHWEGFVKGAANAYVNYVSHRANQNRDLKPCFVALGMKTKLASANASSKSEVVIDAVTYLLDELNRPIRLPRSEAIGGESNLSSLVFLNITGWIGIDSTPYSTRFPLIDATLLDNRNRIAHGEYLSVNAERFYELTGEVLEMLRWFKTDIENAAVQNSFLKA